jgi:hypothetical protein
MQIVCPACAATYEVPMTLLKPGQVARCARCAGEWVPSPAVPEAPMESVSEETPGAAPEREFEPEVARPRRPPMARPAAARSSVALRLAWAASVIVVLFAGWEAYAARTTIMQAWPPSVRLYAALGLAAGN